MGLADSLPPAPAQVDKGPSSTKQGARHRWPACNCGPTAASGTSMRTGSGSVGTPARLRPGHVWAIEKTRPIPCHCRPERRAFGVSNHRWCTARPPRAGCVARTRTPFHRRPGGELRRADRPVPAACAGGGLVMNFVTLENLATATQALAWLKPAVWDVLLQAARSNPFAHARMAAENPCGSCAQRGGEQCDASRVSRANRARGGAHGRDHPSESRHWAASSASPSAPATRASSPAQPGPNCAHRCRVIPRAQHQNAQLRV